MRMIWFARTFLAYSAEHKERTKLFSEDFSGKCNEKVELDWAKAPSYPSEVFFQCDWEAAQQQSEQVLYLQPPTSHYKWINCSPGIAELHNTPHIHMYVESH